MEGTGEKKYRVFLIDDEPWALVYLEKIVDWGQYGFEIAGMFEMCIRDRPGGHDVPVHGLDR